MLLEDLEPRQPVGKGRDGRRTSAGGHNGWRVDASGRAILVSVIDNLLKGASGQAVQNLNVMIGLDERTGLL